MTNRHRANSGLSIDDRQRIIMMSQNRHLAPIPAVSSEAKGRVA
jgi:hypothetical protein